MQTTSHSPTIAQRSLRARPCRPGGPPGATSPILPGPRTVSTLACLDKRAGRADGFFGRVQPMDLA
jgi:hypothetical protein